MKRIVKLGQLIVATLLLCIGNAALARDIAFVPVTRSVYAAIGDTGGRTYDNQALNANFGLIVTPQGAVLIDSGATWRGAEAIHAAVRRVTDIPLRYVINTGSQDHRWLGNAYFRAQGVAVIAAADGSSDMQLRGNDQLAALQPLLKEKLERTVPALPTETFGRQRVIELGGLRIELHYVGGGHTPGDLFVWLPQHGIVFSGDIVYVQRLLSVLPVSNTKAWLASFDAIEAMRPAVIVPGHGRVTQLAEAKRETQAYLVALRAHMKAAVDGGTDLQRAIETFDDRAFAHLLNYTELRGPNASRVYLEVERE